MDPRDNVQSVTESALELIGPHVGGYASMTQRVAGAPPLRGGRSVDSAAFTVIDWWIDIPTRGGLR